MAKAGQRKCLFRGMFFLPDYRSGSRQRCFFAAQCRLASQAVSQTA